jgi:phosphoribosyl 1,2-cyclic phosphate phosphodiesterase
MVRGHFLFLGTGAALGVPMVACPCPVCHSKSPHNKRLRPAGLIKVGDKQILIDAGPDIRSQLLKYDVKHLDGVAITHPHFDHIAGIDDLRPYAFFSGKPLPCLLSKETFDELTLRHHYLMKGKLFSFQLLKKEFGKEDFLGLPFHYVSYFQKEMKVTGYRLGNFAYISDIRKYTDEVIEQLKGVKTLVLSALRHASTEVHFGIDEAREFAEKVGAEQTYFTHIAHDIDHEEVSKQLPAHVKLSYDGLEIPFEI